MSRPTIIINDLDAERIDILLEQPAYAGLPIADALNAELDRAQMCSPEEMPHDVVTMNSRVKFRNLSDGEVRVRTLVYPAKMTDSNTQLSVMAPVGAAPVSYTHLTLPTNREVSILLVAVSFKKKNQGKMKVSRMLE